MRNVPPFSELKRGTQLLPISKLKLNASTDDLFESGQPNVSRKFRVVIMAQLEMNKATQTASSLQNEETVEEILYPKTIIPNNKNLVVVTEKQIERGTRFGPFPGQDAVEKKNADWMQYVTTVESLNESNLLICFRNDQLYFYCHRLIYIGTELVVWGGSKRMHWQEPSQWKLNGVNNDGLTFACQDCDKSWNNEKGVYGHWNSLHRKPEEIIPDKNCQCPHCFKTIGSKTHYRVHVLQHGINLSEETLYQKLKKNKGKKRRNVPEKEGKPKKLPGKEEKPKKLPGKEEKPKKLPGKEEKRKKLPEKEEKRENLPETEEKRENLPETEEKRENLPETEEKRENLPETEIKRENLPETEVKQEF